MVASQGGAPRHTGHRRSRWKSCGTHSPGSQEQDGESKASKPDAVMSPHGDGSCEEWS